MAAENYRAPSVAQSAELAEQQGDMSELLAEMRDVEDYFDDVDPNPIHLATVQAAISALAATGKQQVGEVQGDALPPLSADEVAAMAPAGLTWDETGAWAMGYEACRKAALAARQPGAQVPVELACVAETLAHGEGLWMTCSGCHESNEGVQTGPYSQIMKCNLGNGCDECGGIGATWDTTDYQQMADAMSKSLAAPPAQGIDLGQFQALAEFGEKFAMSVERQPHSRVIYSQASRLLALIDQRDAAPGVGNG